MRVWVLALIFFGLAGSANGQESVSHLFATVKTVCLDTDAAPDAVALAAAREGLRQTSRDGNSLSWEGHKPHIGALIVSLNTLSADPGHAVTLCYVIGREDTALAGEVESWAAVPARVRKGRIDYAFKDVEGRRVPLTDAEMAVSPAPGERRRILGLISGSGPVIVVYARSGR